MKLSIVMALFAVSVGCAGSESHFSTYSRATSASECPAETQAFQSIHGVVCAPPEATPASVEEFLGSLGLETEQAPALCADVEVCEDGIDNTCDGQLDEGCGGKLCATRAECPDGQVCIPTGVQDRCTQCGADEICGDALDNNCDGNVDEECQP